MRGGEIVTDFEKLFRDYQDFIYKYLLRLTKSYTLAEEFTQETFFQALKSIDSFRGDCKIYVWLCSIAKHLWYKELKKKDREVAAEYVEETTCQKITENSAIQKMEVIELYKKLHLLEEPVREVMYLRLNADFTFKEIGEIMGKDENWARVTFYRGKQRIRKESNHEM